MTVSLWADTEDDRLRFARGWLPDVELLLATEHYLGPKTGGPLLYAFTGVRRGLVVAAQVWGLPTSRRLPNDGSWLELTRWCLTPTAGRFAGSRMQGWVRRWLLRNAPEVSTLVSYSDPSAGHTGALYRACGWMWAPTWHRISPPPSGAGSWDGFTREEPKDRWVYPLRPDPNRAALLAMPYPHAQRKYEQVLAERAVAASSDASVYQTDEGGSQPTLPLHSENVA